MSREAHTHSEIGYGAAHVLVSPHVIVVHIIVHARRNSDWREVGENERLSCRDRVVTEARVPRIDAESCNASDRSSDRSIDIVSSLISNDGANRFARTEARGGRRYHS